MTNAERQAAYKARLFQQGLVQVNLIVPVAALADLQRAAELLRGNPTWTVARLVDTTTGKLKGLKKG